MISLLSFPDTYKVISFIHKFIICLVYKNVLIFVTSIIPRGIWRNPVSLGLRGKKKFLVLELSFKDIFLYQF